MQAHEELVGVYNDDGTYTNTCLPRSEVHQRGLWHQAVHVWVMNSDNDVIIQKRHPKKDGSPNKWDVSCGGHCVGGENAVSGAIRELEEELGITATSDDLIRLGQIKYISQEGRNREFIDVFVLHNNTPPIPPAVSGR